MATLSTQSVDDTVNGTRVVRVDGDVDKEICIVGKTFLIDTADTITHYIVVLHT